MKIAAKKPDASARRVRVVVRIRPVHEREQHRRVCIHTLDDPRRTTTQPDSEKTEEANIAKENWTEGSKAPGLTHKPPSRQVLGKLSRLVSPKQRRVLTPKNDATPLMRNTNRKQPSSEVVPPSSPLTLTIAAPAAITTQLVVEHNSSPPSRTFSFDAVLGPDRTQRDVYHQAGLSDAVENLFYGYNATVLAYGQTASGKTHTMCGPNGIMEQAVQQLFEGAGPDVTFLLSYLEIYNDELRDLLADDDRNVTNRRRATALRLWDVNGCTSVEGLQQWSVSSPDDAARCLTLAHDRRVTASTSANTRSSRSHAVCTITVQNRSTTAKLNLVDLAGSERIKQTGVQGQQQVESISINKDLLVLGQVVSALANSAAPPRHVPYRECKLTRLLRDAVGGNCFTVMIACVAPTDLSVDESINTLRYAERARDVTNHVRQNNISPVASKVEQLRAENVRLRQELEQQSTVFVAAAVTEMDTVKVQDSLIAHVEGKPCFFDLANLELKVAEARDEARSVRELSASVTNTVTSWKERMKPTVSKLASKAGRHVVRSPLPCMASPSNTVNCYRYQCSSGAKQSDEAKHGDLTMTAANDVRQINERATRRLFQSPKAKHTRWASWRDRLCGDKSVAVDTSTDLLVSSPIKSVFLQRFDELQTAFAAEREHRMMLQTQLEAMVAHFGNLPADIGNPSENNSQASLGKERSGNDGDDDEDESDSVFGPADQLLKNGTDNIRSEALRMLQWAERIHTQRHAGSGSVGSGSSAGTLMMPVFNDKLESAHDEHDGQTAAAASPPADQRIRTRQAETPIFISNIERVNEETTELCDCEELTFAGNAEHAEFYLPQLNVPCTCGRRGCEQYNCDEYDFSRLEVVLRDWQHRFLASAGMHETAEFVRVHGERSDELAKAMKAWRKDQGMKSVRTASCRIALHIWCKTCTLVLQSAKQQQADGATIVTRPDFLSVASAQSDNRTISTLGVESAFE